MGKLPIPPFVSVNNSRVEYSDQEIQQFLSSAD
jgi:hypothetical protein